MLSEKLTRIPRTTLWSHPTPLEAAPSLAKCLGAENIWIKRDDCNGLAFGGNKVRQMEYYLGDALCKGADTLLITGAVQSNFVRTAAAACAKNGLQCQVQLEARVSKSSDAYARSGNVLLDQMLGATIHHFPVGEDEEGADRNLEEIAAQLKVDGRNPYVVHLHPSHPPLGSLGYIDAAFELDQQLKAQDLSVDAVFVPSGSGNTHGGFLYGWKGIGNTAPVMGSCVRRDANLQRPRIETRLEQIGALLVDEPAAKAKDVHLTDEFLAPGYGVAGDVVKETIALAAQHEALILDPVYTGKTFAAAFEHVKANPGCNIVVFHTGGGPSIFGYGVEDLLP
ncbi:MAG: D-cysteine desulfhydrase family protein [Rhizobiaceae bacterium]|nr:D-cysteine desulfhydrase family protein [Rhizobiaceae bacterium]